MPDLKIRQDTTSPAERVWLDFVQAPDGLLAEGAALEAAAIVALGTEGRALADDVLPDPDDTDRRGWWGDLDAPAIWDGWPIGCRLWVLQRSKITGPLAREGDTLVRVEAMLHEAFQPFVERRICSRYTVDVMRHGRERIEARVRLYRGPDDAIELRFHDLWDELGG